MSRTWRLLCDGEASGAWNMAVDEALLESVQQRGDPVLRLYRWRGPWLSLGYGQRFDAHRLERCRAAGVGVVRRVTGGRAVLHGGDLTYALVAPESELPPGLRASYGLVCRALGRGLDRIGVSARVDPAGGPGSHRTAFDCFREPAEDELCAGGLKLAGSAQRRAGGGVLQHGSLRVRPDSAVARSAAGLEEGVATSLRELGCEVSLDELVEALSGAFSEVLGVPLEKGQLDGSESRRAQQLSEQRPEPQASHSIGISRVPPDGR